jgi:hypothetical protein
MKGGVHLSAYYLMRVNTRLRVSCPYADRQYPLL